MLLALLLGFGILLVGFVWHVFAEDPDAFMRFWSNKFLRKKEKTNAKSQKVR